MRSRTERKAFLPIITKNRQRQCFRADLFHERSLVGRQDTILIVRLDGLVCGPVGVRIPFRIRKIYIKELAW